MAGNKALEKFKDSKVPKKGAGTTNAELKIYSEPNTHSKVLGTIKKGETINWISKSICEEKEWVRCDGNNSFGYIIINTMDGTCNLNMDSVKETKEEKVEKKEANIENQITKEENDIVNEALREILEEDGKKDEHNDSNFSNSTGIGNISNTNQNETFDKAEEEYNNIFNGKNDFVFEPKNDELFKEDNLDNLYFDGDVTNLDGAIKENNKILSDLLNMMDQDKEKETNISKALESISDILPGDKSLTKKDLLCQLDSLPLGKIQNNYINNGN